MITKHTAGIGIVLAALLLLSLALAAAPAAPVGTASFAKVSAAAAQEAAPAEGAAAKEGAKKEDFPRTTGQLTPAQTQDLRNAYAGMGGYDLLIVSILGLLATVGIVGFGAYKQAKA